MQKLLALCNQHDQQQQQQQQPADGQAVVSVPSKPVAAAGCSGTADVAAKYRQVYLGELGDLLICSFLMHVFRTPPVRMYVPVCLSVRLSVCLFASLFDCLCVCVSVCLPISLAVYICLCLSVCLSAYLCAYVPPPPPGPMHCADSLDGRDWKV